MSGYKTDQRRLVHRGREFHFVSYEGHLANPGRGVDAMPATWFLMTGGKRWAVMPQVPDQEVGDLETHFMDWLDEHVFSGVPKSGRARRPPRTR